jgi:hypothetical protein
MILFIAFIIKLFCAFQTIIKQHFSTTTNWVEINLPIQYGAFDMERILRLMRPSKDEVLIKESGMHAVENFND